MAADLDIENRDELQRYLRANFAPAEEFEIREFRILAGGVSSRTVLVELSGGQRWVLKQALAKLRVAADWFSDPARVHREALGMRVLGELVPGRVPQLIFDDERHHVLGMEAVPEPHENWKSMLLAGNIDEKVAGNFGELLGTIHRESWRRREELAPLFDDRSVFESLRIEPYYQYSAIQEPRAAGFLEQLIAETRANRLALVHGDFSPKNVLVRDRQVTLLDHEVIHWGDPAFDVGFAFSHFMGKGFAGRKAGDFDTRGVPSDKAFQLGIPTSTAKLLYPFWRRYRHALSEVAWPKGFERRCAQHSLACVLARSVGRSPLEYLSPDVRKLLSGAVVDVIHHSPVPGDIHSVAARISCALYGFYREDHAPSLVSIKMNNPPITHLRAREILDSRGRPTVWAACELAGGAVGAISVPSGASTGKAEALELRDGDPKRYSGLGCRRAVANVNGPINAALAGKTFATQHDLDAALIALDGTPHKSALGANALLAVSLAFARASAAAAGKPLYDQFAEIAGPAIAARPPTLPRMTINLFSGGKHAGGQVCIQDVLVVPAAARTVDEGLTVTYAVYQAAARLTQEKYDARALKADEGGLAPPFPTTEAMLADAVEAIRLAGFEPGRDVALAVDVASSHFYEPDSGKYVFDGRPLSSADMIRLVAGWLDRYPIVSLEDALSEEDWPNWPALRNALGDRALTLGDDFLCTNPARIRRAIDAGCANALLLKVNQIGTLSEAAEALRLARSAGWRVTISARSGETEDDWLADLSVGWRGDQLKVGSITGGERLAKYNRLLAIEAETGRPIVAWPAPD